MSSELIPELWETKLLMDKYKRELASIQPDIIQSPEFKELEEQFQKTLIAASL
ncbi:hypothetical protein [Fictibacillus nanhaiensis]|uniref:hypothetical protein n=1 Tax=Fictibacillus nanhaiensis TaxID=742169 RepID=UPI003C20FFBB